jgi:uncharacterized protein YbjT (DUF2867 family)
MEKTILVIGGTGMLGQPVARCLKEAEFRVRIMTRDHQKARKLFDESFEIVAGNPVDAGCLAQALEDCVGVHISLPTAVEQQVAEVVATTAPKHGVERITYISGTTVTEENRWSPAINRKFLAEQAIRASGVPYTIFCPTWFMESLPLFVVQGRASLLGKQPHFYHWVAADDYASMVARAYGLAEAANQQFIVHGPEALRMHEALRRYCAVFHPDITQVSTLPFWLVTLLATLTRNQELKAGGELMAYFDKIGEGPAPATANPLLGTPTTTFNQWLERRKARLDAVGAVGVGLPHSYSKAI